MQIWGIMEKGYILQKIVTIRGGMLTIQGT